MSTPQFQRFIAPARAHPQIWRLLLGLVVLTLTYMCGIGLLIGAIWFAAGTEALPFWLAQMTEGLSPTGTLLLLMSFSGMALGPVLAARLLHKRRAATLFGPGTRVVRDFTLAALVVGLVNAVSLMLWSSQFDAIPNVPLGTWLMFLPMALVGLLIQTMAEELVFRGYLQQQLAARFSARFAWMVLPSLLFGLAHFDPHSAGGNAWFIVASAGLFGLVAADLTALTGSIGAAWGFHFANNVFAMLFVSVEGTLPGLALYVTPYAADDTESLGFLIMADMVILGLTWIACRRFLLR